MAPFETDVSAEMADQLVSAARTALGDELRGVVYFTPATFDVLYVRQDLYDADEDAREAKAQLVDLETVGFAEGPVRDALADTEPAPIGPYQFTVRFHRDGFVTRIIQGAAGVILTTDSMDVTAFEEAATSIRTLLTE